MADQAAELMKAPRIRFHLNVHEPVELVEMTLAFQGLGFEYQNFIKARREPANDKKHKSDVKLYITRIETNCILAEMAPALPLLGALAPVFADANAVAEFVRNMGQLIDWLRKAGKDKSLTAADVPHSKKKIGNVKDVVKLVGKNKGGNLGLTALKYEEKTGQDIKILEMNFSQKECREAENGAYRVLQVLEDGEKADKEKVLLYFFQTNTDDPKSGGRTGDKGLIASVSPKPLSVYVLSEVDQQRIRHVLDDKGQNPLHTGFVVDVNIENDRKGMPKIYRVLRIHDVEYDDSVNEA
jgi:hypothetical protein